MEKMMKKLLLCLMFVSYLLPLPVGSAAERQDQDAVLKSFQQIANKYTDFFQRTPMLLSKVTPPDNPRTQAYYMTFFPVNKIFFDIVKTNSIVMPYSGYIAVDTDVFDNTLCGNVSFNKTQKNGWATIDEAIKKFEDRACFMSRTDASGPIQHRFNFLYQAITRKWVLTNITYQNGEINSRFMVLLGVAAPSFPVMTEAQALKFNKPWIDLFKNP